MAEQKEPKKYQKFKVLSIGKGGSYEKGGKTITKSKIILQGTTDTTVILDGEAKNPLPENVVVDGVVEDVWVYENEFKGDTTFGLFFPDGKGSGSGGGGYSKGGGYGKSAEELAIMRYEAVVRNIDVNTKYAVDLVIARGDDIGAGAVVKELDVLMENNVDLIQKLGG